MSPSHPSPSTARRRLGAPNWSLAVVLAGASLPWSTAGCDANETSPRVTEASAAVPKQASGSPLGTLAPAMPNERELDGIVRERLPAGSYVYLAIETDVRRYWVATPGSTAEVGSRVHVSSLGTRRDFHSPRLQRSFDELVFGVVVPAATERNPT